LERQAARWARQTAPNVVLVDDPDAQIDDIRALVEELRPGQMLTFAVGISPDYELDPLDAEDAGATVVRLGHILDDLAVERERHYSVGLTYYQFESDQEEEEDEVYDEELDEDEGDEDLDDDEIDEDQGYEDPDEAYDDEEDEDLDDDPDENEDLEEEDEEPAPLVAVIKVVRLSRGQL